jgi:predicted ATPase
MRVAVARHDELLRAVIEEHGGEVFSTMGDGVAAAFSSAPSAIAAALDGQRLLEAEHWPTTEPICVRMGLHTGEAQRRGDDYFGTAVNRAARLTAVGHGRQVLCSGTTAGLVEAEVPLVDLGEHRLRDLDRPMHVFQVGASAFAHLRSLDAFPGNPPLQVSSFFGRERELERVAGLLGECRMVTLTGVGGVGKTRLALQVAAEVLPRFREGAWVVELAPVRDEAGVVEAVAATFGVSARAGLTLEESLVGFLRTKQLLLIADNCEHLLEPVAELLDTLQRLCPGLVVLATSREGLALEGERMVAVPSLAAPRPGAGFDAISDSDAVRLFIDRARQADTDLELTQGNAGAVLEVCRRLDGVPLAIELAAARVGAMTPGELAAGLDRRFEMITGARRRAVKRRQTLRAAIDWSYELCSVAEQRLLARLAVFAGGATRAAVEAVCRTEPLGRAQVFELLVRLVAKSLVVAAGDAPETRYRLLETIREYGDERLAEHAETEALRSAHAEYYCTLLQVLHSEMEGHGRSRRAGASPSSRRTSSRQCTMRSTPLTPIWHCGSSTTLPRHQSGSGTRCCCRSAPCSISPGPPTIPCTPTASACPPTTPPLAATSPVSSRPASWRSPRRTASARTLKIGG